jgi:hypothetical protein
MLVMWLTPLKIGDAPIEITLDAPKPDWLKDLISLYQLCQHFQESKPLSPEFTKKLVSRLTQESQKQNLIYIQNLPKVPKAMLSKILESSLFKGRSKILCPTLDIYMPTDDNYNSVGYCFV